MNTSRCALALLILLCASCRDEAAIGVRQIALNWDTLRVEVTALDVSAPRPTWSVALATPSSDALEAMSTELFQARSAVMLDDSRLALANTGANQLLLVDAAEVRGVGAEGGGPGEFEALWSVHRGRADSIVAYDRGNQRLSWFTLDGVYRRSRRLQTGLPGELQVLGPLNDTTWAVILIRGPEGFRLNRHGPAPRSATLALLTDSEQVVVVGEFPYAEEYVYGSSATRSIYRRPVPGTRRMEAAPGRGSLVLAFTDEYRLGVFSEDGTLVRFLLGNTVDLPASVADREAWISTGSESVDDEGLRELYRLMWQNGVVPERWPHVGQVRVSADQHVWVENPRPAGSEGTMWDIWDLHGAPKAQALLPAGIEVLDIGSDALVARALDDLGREYIRIYEIKR